MAIKQIDLEHADDDIAEIQLEIAHLMDCDSQWITRYYGSFVRGYNLWIIMEYLAGGSCLDLVRRPAGACRVAGTRLETLILSIPTAQAWTVLGSSDRNRLSRVTAWS